MKKALPNQNSFFDLIYEQMAQGETIFFISGNAGIGKSVSIQMISDNLKSANMLPICLNGDSILSSNEYLPFLNALSEALPYNAEYGLQQIILDYSDNIPKIGKRITGILKLFAKRNEAQLRIRDLTLNEREQDIVCKIQYLAEHKDIAFICDNLNCWDEKSLKLLYTILRNIKGKYDFLSKSIFLIIYTSNKEAVHDKLIDAISHIDDVKLIHYPVIKYADFKKTLDILGYSGNLSQKESSILFSLINGHIKMLTELITELNGNKLSLNKLEGKSKDLLTAILRQRLRDCGATGEQIKTTLEYASLLGLSFSIYELNRVMEIEDSVFYNIINHSNELNLIEKADYKNDTLQFAHDIIREIFEREVGENSDYYKKIELCLKEIEPGQYFRRSQYAFKAADFQQSSILFVLDILRQIREDGDISAFYMEKCEILFGNSVNNNLYYKFIMYMRKAYNLYREGNYNDALNSLFVLGDIYPKEFLAEKEILCSYCYTKKLDPNYRTNGLEKLRYFALIENCNYERDIYERVLVRLMILYVHLGDTENANNIEKKVVDSLKIRFNHDAAARSRFYTLNRISNAIYSCEISVNKMKEAVDYFGINYKAGGLWKDIKQFYLSKVNYAGALCLNGKFKESYKKNEELLALYQKFPDYPFPRPNILLNNYLISAYLSNQITVNECVSAYKDFVSALPVTAERLFYISNYSIFLALSGNLKKALILINQEGDLQNAKNDKERIYNYRVALNSAVYNYLLGNKHNALDIICKLKEQMEAYPSKGDFQYDFFRVSKILSLITDITDFTEISSVEWENILLKESNEFQTTAWNYYGKGFVFTVVFNWDL